MAADCWQQGEDGTLDFAGERGWSPVSAVHTPLGSFQSVVSFLFALVVILIVPRLWFPFLTAAPPSSPLTSYLLFVPVHINIGSITNPWIRR
ncbi:hypothetical protein SLEP1_g52730 [Rubroshorea leprosula]|uniref:Uncharacterized protein n=1 Tax=Rubroshorea leprosula TaxID=152421 RepID=A0AAV5MAZ4_9ROSI|nr:hypothetical protein SLEP1_g52730 [Rubroshorea leprosula]